MQPEEPKGTLFHLTTSTHASYNFDITTGEILEEHRLWRQVARFGLVTLILAVISGGALLLYRIRHMRALSYVINENGAIEPG